MKIKLFLSGCLLNILTCSTKTQQVWPPDNEDGTFMNPIMWGDWPDPDVIRVGDEQLTGMTMILVTT